MKKTKPIKAVRKWTRKNHKKQYIYYIFVCLLFFLAIITRYFHLQSIRKNDTAFYNLPAGTDMLTYDNQAQEILKGNHPTPYYYGPLYPYLLSLIYFIFGHNLLIPRVIQMIFGIFTCLFIFLITKRVFGKEIGFISLILSVFYDMFIIHEGLLLLETLATFLNTILIFSLLKFEEKKELKYIILGGAFLGLSALSRANILLFLFFVFIWMLIFFKKNGIFYFFLFSLTAFIFISPATIMNYKASKKFIPVTTNGPILFWIGNNECADGTYLIYPIPERLKNRIAEIKDRAYIEDVIRFIKEKPKMFIKLSIKKFFLFWGRFEIANNMNYEDIKRASFVIRLPFFIGFGFVAPFAIFGIFLSLKKKNLLLLFFIFSYMFSIIAIHVLGRYRIGFIPAIIPFAAFALFWIFEKIKKLEYKKLLLSLPILLFSFVIVWQEDIRIFYFIFKHPYGIHENWVITDAKCDLSKRNDITLYNSESAKKEFIIIEDLSLVKDIKLSFDYMAYGEGRLIINVNDGTYYIKTDIKPTQGMGFNFCNITLPTKFFKKGKNSFVFKVEGNWAFSFPYDPTHSFGRSFQFVNGRFKKINGEFIASLTMNKGQ